MTEVPAEEAPGVQIAPHQRLKYMNSARERFMGRQIGTVRTFKIPVVLLLSVIADLDGDQSFSIG